MTRLAGLVDRLQAFYGALPQPPDDPFILFVWEVLAVHSTPRKRDAALGALKRLRALTPDAMSRAPQKKLEEAVALAGAYVEQRLRALRTGADLFRRDPRLADTIRGPILGARRAVDTLPGMGETAGHRMLLFAGDRAVMPVDARTARVGLRLGYGEPLDDVRKTARAVRLALERDLAPPVVDEYRRTFLYLDHHGAATCAEGDPHCQVCPLVKRCPDALQRGNRDS